MRDGVVIVRIVFLKLLGSEFQLGHRHGRNRLGGNVDRSSGSALGAGGPRTTRQNERCLRGAAPKSVEQSGGTPEWLESPPPGPGRWKRDRRPGSRQGPGGPWQEEAGRRFGEETESGAGQEEVPDPMSSREVRAAPGPVLRVPDAAPEGEGWPPTKAGPETP